MKNTTKKKSLCVYASIFGKIPIERGAAGRIYIYIDIGTNMDIVCVSFYRYICVGLCSITLAFFSLSMPILHFQPHCKSVTEEIIIAYCIFFIIYIEWRITCEKWGGTQSTCVPIQYACILCSSPLSKSLLCGVCYDDRHMIMALSGI